MDNILIQAEESIWKLLTFNQDMPLIFNSGLFLFLFAIFSFFYCAMRRKVMLRILYVTCFSLFFYYKSSGIYFLLIIFTATSDFIIGLNMSRYSNSIVRKWLVFASVAINLGMLFYFKYTGFFFKIVNNLTGSTITDFENIFLPVGISFFVFQSLSYTIDIYRGKIQPLTRWLDYLFYLSFFPQLVAGPIVRARDFIPQIRQSPIIVTRSMYSKGVLLFIIGLFKKAVISDFININFVDRIFEQPLLYTGIENLLGVYGYALQIFCDFSGYSDMAIGIALLLGFHFEKNFNTPYKSATVTEFWQRWHISLSTWLKDYLYVSIGGNRKGKIRTYVNLLITMLLGGLWHGASLNFIFWGALHGSALAIHKISMNIFPSLKATGIQMKLPGRILGTIFTFHIVCLGWVFFRADDMTLGFDMLKQIFGNFNGSLLPQIVKGYGSIMILMALGYMLHYLPVKWTLSVEKWSVRVPLVAHAFVLAILIWFIMQIKSSDIQPFIYFNF